MSNFLRYTSASIMAVLASFGISINGYVLRALLRSNNHLSIFYKLCISKTLCNLITCSAFAFWSAPCTFLNFYYLPQWVNLVWGQIAGWGVYITGICIQLCMSLNRFTVTYFPFSSNKNNKVLNVTNCLLILFSIFVFSTVYGFPEGCGYVYIIESLSWSAMDSKCALDHADQLFYFILVIALISNSSNLATFLKLYKTTKTAGLTRFQCSRSKKSRLMFAQSVTQDCLHVVDMLACQVVYKFNEELWFQFICMSVVWLSIHVFDGFVMLLYNQEILPDCLKKTRKRFSTTSSPSIVISRVF